MSAGATPQVRLRSLLWATGVELSPGVVARGDGYLVIRSPGNPSHYWGNLLLFDDPPAAGDGQRWERLFATVFDGDSGVQHRTFAWDRTDGALGWAREEFVERGFELDETVGLVAAASDIRPHLRQHRDIIVRALRPASGVDEDLWEQVVDLQVAARRESGRPFDEPKHRAFRHKRLDDMRALFRRDRGAWYVAINRNGDEDEVLASCGIALTTAGARFQAVDTAVAHRRRGICSRLIVEAARDIVERHGTQRFVIGADPGYHALGIYESLGFQKAERVSGVLRPPIDPATIWERGPSR